jgi:hypothetical protein
MNPEGTWERITLTGTSGPLLADQIGLALATKKAGSAKFKLHTSVITIECTTLSSPTTLIGGMPAKDYAEIKFSGCTVEGHASCTVNSPGEAVGSITTAANTEVVYLKKEEGGKLGDLFTPVEGETFVELVIGGTGCPLFTKGEQEVKGSVIGEIKPVNSMSKTGELIFPGEGGITKAYKWNGGTLEEVKASLKVFSVINAEQIGESEVMLNSNEEWGVTTT